MDSDNLSTVDGLDRNVYMTNSHTGENRIVHRGGYHRRAHTTPFNCSINLPIPINTHCSTNIPVDTNCSSYLPRSLMVGVLNPNYDNIIRSRSQDELFLDNRKCRSLPPPRVNYNTKLWLICGNTSNVNQ